MSYPIDLWVLLALAVTLIWSIMAGVMGLFRIHPPMRKRAKKNAPFIGNTEPWFYSRCFLCFCAPLLGRKPPHPGGGYFFDSPPRRRPFSLSGHCIVLGA